MRQPYSSMVADPSGGMTVVAVASSTMAGPSMEHPAARASRWNRAVAQGPLVNRTGVVLDGESDGWSGPVVGPQERAPHIT